VTGDTLFFVLARVVGFVFAVSALAKVNYFSDTVDGLVEWRLVRPKYVPIAVGLLIAVELVLALSHLSMFALTELVPVTMVTLTGFLAVTVYLAAKGRRVPCLCFGARDHEAVGWRTFARIALLLMVETAMLVLAWNYGVLGLVGLGVLENLSAFVVAGALVVLSSILFSASDILEWIVLIRKNGFAPLLGGARQAFLE